MNKFPIHPNRLLHCYLFLSQVQVMSGSHSMVQHIRTTVLWPWRTLVKGGMPCSASLTSLLVVEMKMGLCSGIGSSPMQVEFSVKHQRISTEPEVRWWYTWTAEEMEWRGSTAVRYLIQWMLSRPYTLECTQQALVSEVVHSYSVTKVKVMWGFMLHTC